MIRIRPGRSWRLNPAYVGELREARPAAFTGADILDVVGIEVDGVDLAAGLGEARVLVAIDELAQALLRLSAGAPAAQATVGKGPTELVLESRGPDVSLSLVSLAPPARVLASGLVVDGARLRAAAAGAAHAVHADLVTISEALRESSLALRLTQAAEELVEPPRRKSRPWPPAEARAINVVVSRASLRLSIEVPDLAAARLKGRRAVADAPLAAHLGASRVRLQAKGVPGVETEGPALLVLRNLLRDARALTDAWEAGDRAATLHLGAHELHLDLTRDELRAPGFSHPALCKPLDVVQLVADAAVKYAARMRVTDDLLADLRDRGEKLLEHARDLESGDLRRAPETVTAPPPRTPRERSQPLSSGRMRRLVYRAAWTFNAPRVLRVLSFPHRLVAELPDALVALDDQSGEELWRVPAAPGAVQRGEDLFYAEEGDALVRLDVHTGQARWRRRLRGAAHPAVLFALPDGVARGLPGEGVALVSDGGALLSRAKLPGGAPAEVQAVDGVLVCALPSFVAGVSDGKLVWKRKLRAERLFGNVAVSSESVALLDPHTGAPLWERTLPVREACLADDVVALLSENKLVGLSLHDGAQLYALEAPWADALRAADDGELIATGATHAACVRDGAFAWRHELPATPAQLRRHIALVGEKLLDLATGAPLAAVPSPATLLSDLSCAVITPDGVTLHRMHGHFAVVTT